MRLWSTHCPKCKVLEKKIELKNIDCEIKDNLDEVLEFGRLHDMNSAPILELDNGEVLDFVAANKYLSNI